MSFVGAVFDRWMCMTIVLNMGVRTLNYNPKRARSRDLLQL